MELIDRYLNEVGRRLSPKTRDDILAELRSVIQDKLDERVLEGQITRAHVIEVLKSMGSPKKVAASFAGERYLIGPALYPTMLRVMQIGLWALLIIPVMGLWQMLTIDFSSMSAAFEFALGKIGDYVNSMLAFIGMVVVIFALLERQDVSIPEQEEKWNPEDLPAINQPGRVSYFDMGMEMAFNFVCFAFLNYFLQQGGIPIFYGAETAGTFLPISPEPFIALMVITVLGFGVQLFVLMRGAWQLSTRLIDAGLDLIGLYYSYGVVQQFALRLTDYIPELEPLNIPNWPIASAFGIVVLIVMGIHGIEIYKQLNPKPITPAPIKTSSAKGV